VVVLFETSGGLISQDSSVERRGSVSVDDEVRLPAVVQVEVDDVLVPVVVGEDRSAHDALVPVHGVHGPALRNIGALVVPRRVW